MTSNNLTISQMQAASNSSNDSKNKIDNLSKDVKECLGEDAKIITNRNGDKIFLSQDGLRKVRFDINNPFPHENAHGHFEKLVNGEWKPVEASRPKIYPKDVPHK